jgi:UDP-N-acetylglucosamine 2-epimerase (non-hydrolysing)
LRVADPRVVVSVVGTRPNFMKMAPIVRALGQEPGAFRHILIHTGQHYDAAMSKIFFEELGVGEPDHMLDVGSGTHAAQTARVMERIEPVLVEIEPDLVLVPGDVNSTLAAALVASKLGIPIGHVEAGLRSFDRSMPEEINRILTDQMSDLLFIHSPEAREHLKREGRPSEHVHYVGNTMIDTLVTMRRTISELDVARAHGVEPGSFVVVTLHRPALVDGPLLAGAMAELDRLGEQMPVIFPIHPRTRRNLAAAGIETRNVELVDPLGYIDFLSLVASARAVLTDSGGIQEETTFLGIPCFTLRDNTERPITCTMGTNQLLGLEPEIPDRLASGHEERRIPPLWDGNAATRLVDVLRERDSFATLASAA